MSPFRHVPGTAGPYYSRGVASVRRVFRASEAALILLAVAVGVAAGLLTFLQNRLAHWAQALIYGLSGSSLSAASKIDPLRLLALPLGGLLLTLGSKAFAARRRAPVDVVEANALHGGAIPVRDTLVVCAQTLVSNGCGASVGLEAAYAQAGG